MTFYKNSNQGENSIKALFNQALGDHEIELLNKMRISIYDDNIFVVIII